MLATNEPKGEQRRFRLSEREREPALSQTRHSLSSGNPTRAGLMSCRVDVLQQTPTYPRWTARGRVCLPTSGLDVVHSVHLNMLSAWITSSTYLVSTKASSSSLAITKTPARRDFRMVIFSPMRIEPSALCVMLPPGGDPFRYYCLRCLLFLVPRYPPSPTQTTVHRASARDFYQDCKWSRKKRLALIFNTIASVTFPHRFSSPALSGWKVGGPGAAVAPKP